MKINPKQLEKMAKRMGMQMDQIEAEEVIIKTPEKNIVIRSPQVTKVNMMGQETFQIVGEISEEEKEPFTEEDIKIVAGQAGISEEEARKALAETHGDLARTILKLKKKK